MMSKRISHASHAPAMHILHRDSLSCTGADGALEYGVRVGDGQYHADRAAAQRFRAEVLMFRRFIAQPELCPLDRESRHHAAFGTIQAKHLSCAKGSLIE